MSRSIVKTHPTWAPQVKTCNGKTFNNGNCVWLYLAAAGIEIGLKCEVLQCGVPSVPAGEEESEVVLLPHGVTDGDAGDIEADLVVLAIGASHASRIGQAVGVDGSPAHHQGIAGRIVSCLVAQRDLDRKVLRATINGK